MTSQLDILAIEPFYGGARRQMLQTLSRLSRHRWNLLTLPARRVERRLAASARWFSELITRIEVEKVQLLFVSEMLNLTDLRRFIPRLARRPTIVYFHDNQTPGETDAGGALDLININNAMAATEVWFNSQYHEDIFLQKTEAMIESIPEIAGCGTIAEVRGKSLVMPPPVDVSSLYEAAEAGPPIHRNSRTLLVDMRIADVAVVIEMCERLIDRDEPFELITIGRQIALPAGLRHRAIPERDETSQYRALFEAAIYIATRPGITSDGLVGPALAAGCWPVVPEPGPYAELIPPVQHLMCLHDGSAEAIVACILDAWYGERPHGADIEQQDIIAGRDAVEACRVMDELLMEVALGGGVRV